MPETDRSTQNPRRSAGAVHRSKRYAPPSSRYVRLANRGLSILTHDLEPQIYDHDDFLEPLKKFILARTFARVRVLIHEPNRVIKTAAASSRWGGG